jgi:diaminopimelate decarboxylase
MKKGEWIIYRNIGAYGYVVATNFNGYQIPQIHYLI